MKTRQEILGRLDVVKCEMRDYADDTQATINEYYAAHQAALRAQIKVLEWVLDWEATDEQDS